MSIKGIDTQIMITRSNEYSRDASAMQKRPEVTQQNIAAQQKVTVAEDQTRVAKTLETENDRIRTDADGGGGGAHGGSEGREQGEDGWDEDDGPGMYVPPSNNIFDIRV